MWDDLKILIRDNEYILRTATGLIVLLSSVLCALIFIIFSFTSLSTHVGIDSYQIAAIIALHIAILALTFVAYLILTYEKPQLSLISRNRRSQLEVVQITTDQKLQKKVTQLTRNRRPQPEITINNTIDDLLEQCKHENASIILACYVPTPSYPRNISKKLKGTNNFRPHISHHFAEISGEDTWLGEIWTGVAYEVLRAQKLMEGHMSMLREASRGVEQLLFQKDENRSDSTELENAVSHENNQTSNHFLEILKKRYE